MQEKKDPKAPKPAAKPGETFQAEVPEGCLDERCEVVRDPAEEAAIEGQGMPGPGVGAD
ncbi:hypothetical protein D3C86_2177240 [compost metagenome]